MRLNGHKTEAGRINVSKENSRYLGNNIPLTAREVMLRVGKDCDSWTDDQLRDYLQTCRTYGIPHKEIAAVLHRSPTWVSSRCTMLGVKDPAKPERKTYQSRRKTPSAPRSYV